jgi:hypothetical protein
MVVVHVHNASLGRDLPSYLVSVANRRDAGADVQELPHPRLVRAGQLLRVPAGNNRRHGRDRQGGDDPDQPAGYCSSLRSDATRGSSSLQPLASYLGDHQVRGLRVRLAAGRRRSACMTGREGLPGLAGITGERGQDPP